MMKKLLFLCLLLPACWTTRSNAQTPLWNFPTGFAIEASPVVAPDGTVFVASYDRTVYALTPAGNVLWQTNLPPPIYIYFATYTGVYGTPAFADGTLYVPSENGKLLAINATNGAVNWTFTTPAEEGLYSSPAVGADGTVYFASYDKKIYAINPNGTQKWASSLGTTIFTSPVVGENGTVYCGSDAGRIYALNATNGATNWVFTTGTTPIAASPAIDTNGNLYIGINSSSNPHFYSISTNGTTNWVFTTGGAIRSSATIASDGTICFGCNDGKLYALNPNGTPKWTFTAAAAIGSSPAIASDGTIYSGCDDANLYAIDANGNLLWTYAVGDKIFTSPAIGPDGTIYFGSEDGSLYLLRGCAAPMNSAWPMFRRNIERVGRQPTPWTNQPPLLTTILNQIIEGTSTLTITNTASDPNGPGQQLRFSLSIGAPTGVSVNFTNGVLTWTPSQADVPSTNVIGVVVKDDGTPQLSDVKCFTVTVEIPRPRIENISMSSGNVDLTWLAIPSRIYRVQFKTNLNDVGWIDLAGDVTANTNIASKTDSTVGADPQRFYRVELLP